MKTNYIALSLAIALFTAFSSCKKDSPTSVPTAATDYTDPKVQETLKTLQQASNGWVMRVYPSKDRLYGGFTSIVKFNDKGEVQASSELLLSDQVYTSLYGIDQSHGMTLNFNTHNPAISIYAEPNTRTGVSPTPLPHKGLDGDNAFQVVSVSADSVVLRGIHTHNFAVLTPLAEGASWEETIDTYKAVSAAFPFPNMSATFGSKTYKSAAFKNRHLVLTDDAGKELSYPFAFTPTGIELYQPTTIDGVEVRSFVFNGKADAPEFVAANGSAKITAHELELETIFSNTLFSTRFETSFVGGRAKTIADALVAFYKDATYWSGNLARFSPVLNGVSLGSRDGVVGVHVSQDFIGTTFEVALPMDITFTAPNTFSFKYRPERITNGDSRALTDPNRPFSVYFWAAIFTNIENDGLPRASSAKLSLADGNTNARSFTITMDNKFLPKEIVLTDTQDPQSVIKFEL